MLIELKKQHQIQGFDVQCRMELVPGELTLLSGPNGSGKSSFIQILKLNQNDLLQSVKTTFIDQFPLKPLNEINFSELEKILIPMRYESLDIYPQIRTRISSFEKTPIKNLSGGQNQIVKIAIGLLLSGELIVLDEPFQFLDQSNQDFLKVILADLKKMNKMILIVEHRMDFIESIIDKYIELRVGETEITIGGH